MEDINQDDNNDARIQQQSYNIEIGRRKRVTNQQKRFANVVDVNLLYENFVEFALSIAKTINILEPNSYTKAIYNSKVN